MIELSYFIASYRNVCFYGIFEVYSRCGCKKYILVVRTLSKTVIFYPPTLCQVSLLNNHLQEILVSVDACV